MPEEGLVQLLLIQDHKIILEISDKTKIIIERNAISREKSTQNTLKKT